VCSGVHVTQETASPALKRWQSVRKVVMKRPGLATVEKFLDTAGASLFVGSAFHPPYTEKMADVAEGMGVPAAVVVRMAVLVNMEPHVPCLNPTCLVCEHVNALEKSPLEHVSRTPHCLLVRVLVSLSRAAGPCLTRAEIPPPPSPPPMRNECLTCLTCSSPTIQTDGTSSLREMMERCGNKVGLPRERQPVKCQAEPGILAGRLRAR